MIGIGDCHVIITLVSAKQVYNGIVNLFNETDPVRLRVHFPVHSGFYLISRVQFHCSIPQDLIIVLASL